MGIIAVKPTTPGQRGLIKIDRSGLWKGGPLKSMTVGKRSTGGRNCYGRITSFHRGGGAKKKYRMVDFSYKNFFGETGIVERIEYDPNRTAFIALVKYSDKYRYVVASKGLKAEDEITTNEKARIRAGNAMLLKNVPVGSIIHSIEITPGRGAKVARSAGAYAKLQGRDGDLVILKLQSGELRRFSSQCMATIGEVSNADHKNTTVGKAGRTRWKGRRPIVRGIAMNPIDHPHGGNADGGTHFSTPWGVPTKGYKTRKKLKYSDSMILKRRN